MKTPIGLELTDAQGYALAELISHLTFEGVRPYAQDDNEARQMAEALSDLQLSLEHAGYFPR